MACCTASLSVSGVPAGAWVVGCANGTAGAPGGAAVGGWPGAAVGGFGFGVGGCGFGCGFCDGGGGFGFCGGGDGCCPRLTVIKVTESSAVANPRTMRETRAWWMRRAVRVVGFILSGAVQAALCFRKESQSEHGQSAA